MCVHAVVMGICSFFSILIVHDFFLDCADTYEHSSSDNRTGS